MTIDGRMGPGTMAAFTKLASNPVTLGKVLDAIAAIRTDITKGKEGDRSDHFRFPNQR